MKLCYDCGDIATMVLAVPNPGEQDYYCIIDGQYQHDTGYPIISIKEG